MYMFMRTRELYVKYASRTSRHTHTETRALPSETERRFGSHDCDDDAAIAVRAGARVYIN